jgi:regulatory protein
VIRKGRFAAGGQREAMREGQREPRRFGSRDERRGGSRAVERGEAGAVDSDTVGPGSLARGADRSNSADPFDPLDPSSNYPPPDSAESSSASASQRAGRSHRPTRSLKMRAIDYLSRREYSRTELTRKLAPFVEEGDALDPLLDALEREGWLSEARFAESVMNRRAARMGVSRIVNELRQHKLDDALIESVGSQLRDTERARAQAVWRKKFGQLPQSPAERVKQARFLAMRGFSGATISQILKGDDDWSDE